MDTDRTNGTGTLRYSDIFLAMYSDNGMSCLHRNHSHVLVYMYSGELEINERNRITRLHRGGLCLHPQGFRSTADQAGLERRAVQGHIPDAHHPVPAGVLQQTGQGHSARKGPQEQVGF